MRKIISILLVFICLNYSSKAQTTYHVSQVTMGEWNTYTEKFDWGAYQKRDMDITMKGNIVLVSDKAGSSYVTGEKTIDKTDDDGTRQIGWNATDEKDRKCVVKLATYTSGSQMLYVIYSDYAYGYVLD